MAKNLCKNSDLTAVFSLAGHKGQVNVLFQTVSHRKKSRVKQGLGRDYAVLVLISYRYPKINFLFGKFRRSALLS